MIESIQKVLAKHWGYNSFLPLQRQAIECVCRGRDGIVVLPTGGGKSLCFQAPAVLMPGLTIVVSPLIALMKDQVDALGECGVAAARMDSSRTPQEQNAVVARIRNKTLKLLYVAPERLVSDAFLAILRAIRLSFVAVDEAHCVSMWGHDFRPEYRQLEILRRTFPAVPIGAYTATATERVRADICEQLRLKNPEVIIGSFDRPNLTYKVRQHADELGQVCEVLDRHTGDSGIIYCIRRKDAEALSAALNARGYKTAPYHAGMTSESRKNNQDDFIRERVQTIVATIAFGMGIDKSNVRYVIHTGMPKSLEHYQQESGRAGRDGLEAECCLFYSPGDYGVWKSLMRDMEPEPYEIAMVKLNEMYGYCTGGLCRHKAILRYFGQDLGKSNCGACDICLGEMDCIKDSLVTAQKILSCIVRLDQRFGGGYTASVLIGSRDQRIIENEHDKLSTYGLLREHPRRTVHDWIEQLVGQDFVSKTGEYNVLKVAPKGWQLLRGQQSPRLLQPARRPVRKAQIAKDSWEGVDRGLFEALRTLRRDIAARTEVPAYVIFDDKTLREMAKRRPSTPEGLLEIRGVGQKKRRQYGDTVLAAIRDFCRAHSLRMDL